MGPYKVQQEALRPPGRRQPWHGTQETAFLKGLFEGMRCGILAIDREGRLVWLNELAAQILELHQPSEPGTPIEHVLPGHPQLVQILREAFSDPCPPNREELELSPGPDGGKTIGFTISLVSPGQGGPEGVAVFFKDLTQIEHKEEQERLKDRLAALGQMAAILAHEIRNPLASIEVTATLLRRRLAGDEEGRAMLDKVTEEVRRLNGIMTSSLTFVRPVSLKLAPQELLPILEEAVDVAVERGGPGVRVETGFCGSIPPFPMDREQLRQLFENLLVNAVDALGGRGIVRIEAETLTPAGVEERFAVVRVADSGPGVPEEEREKIFYPFFTTKKQGSGIGLSMAKKIVDCHRGGIEVGSASTGGALFTVRLPMG